MAWVPPPRLVAQTALQIHRSLATRVGGPPPPTDAGAQREDQAAVAAAAVVVLDAEEGPPAAAGPVQPSDAPPPHLLRAGVNLAATGTDAPLAPLAPQGVPPRAQLPRVEAPQAPWRLRVLRGPRGPRAQVPPMLTPQVAEAPQTPRVQQRPRRPREPLDVGLPTPPLAVRAVRPRLPPVLPRTLAETAAVGALAAERVSARARFQREEAVSAEAWAEAVVLHARILRHQSLEAGSTALQRGDPEALELEMERVALLGRQAALPQRFLEEASA